MRAAEATLYEPASFNFESALISAFAKTALYSGFQA